MQKRKWRIVDLRFHVPSFQTLLIVQAIDQQVPAACIQSMQLCNSLTDTLSD